MAAATLLATGSPRRGWGLLLERRPELPTLVAAAAAWVALLWLLLTPGSAAPTSAPGHHDHAGMTRPELPGGEGWLTDAGRGALLWVLMLVAMMLPLAVPGIRYVARMVPRRGRLAATTTFAAAYVAAWLPGMVLAVGVHVLTPPRWPVVTGAFLLAASWELTPVKRTALLRCHRRRVVRARQPGRLRTSAAFGFRRGGWCVVSCGPAMLALMVAQHAVAPMLLLAGGAAVQQLTPDAHWFRHWSAAVLAVLAVTSPWLT